MTFDLILFALISTSALLLLATFFWMKDLANLEDEQKRHVATQYDLAIARAELEDANRELEEYRAWIDLQPKQEQGD